MNSSSGSVLLMALITCAVLYLAAATLLLLTLTEVQIADFESRSLQALYAAESSLTLGLARLRREHNYRADVSDTLLIGNYPALLTVSVTPQVFDAAPSLYHLTLRGVGVVSGPRVSTVRRVEQGVVIKPFALLASGAVTLGDHCRITGNVHGNGPVRLGSQSQVRGNVSSSVAVARADGASDVSELVQDGRISAREPALTMPVLDLTQYYPTYWFDGQPGRAQPLTSDTVALNPDGADGPPAPFIIVYSGLPTSDNPANIFYPVEPLRGPLTAIDLDGTLVIPPHYAASTLSLTGLVSIRPVANLPAIISAKDLDLTLMSGEALKKYAGSLKNTRIAGLLYSSGAVTLRGADATGQILTGSVMGATITVTADLLFQISYDPALLAAPPPGIDFLESGAWRELFAP